MLSTSERISLHCGITDLNDQTIGRSDCHRDKVLAVRVGNVIEIKTKKHGMDHIARIQFAQHSSGLGIVAFSG